MSDTFDRLTGTGGIDPEYPAAALVARKAERAGRVAAVNPLHQELVSPDFGGNSPVPPAIRAAQVAEADRRDPNFNKPPELESANLESD